MSTKKKENRQYLQIVYDVMSTMLGFQELDNIIDVIAVEPLNFIGRIAHRNYVLLWFTQI